MSTVLLVSPCSPGSGGPIFLSSPGNGKAFRALSYSDRVPVDSVLVPKECSASSHCESHHRQ